MLKLVYNTGKVAEFSYKRFWFSSTRWIIGRVRDNYVHYAFWRDTGDESSEIPLSLKIRLNNTLLYNDLMKEVS